MIRLLLLCLLTTSIAFAQPWQPEILWDQSGHGDSSRFGYHILALGDQNDDGYADFGIWSYGAGAPTLDDSGKVELFHGGNPVSTIPYYTFCLDSNLYAIYDAAVAGDINGDGYQDLLLELSFGGGWQTRSAYVFYCGPLLDSQPDARLPPYPYAFIGGSSPIGDFNGDGFDDLYLHDYDNSLQIYDGGNPPDTLADWTRHRPPASYEELSPSGFGDLDADGYDDWISSLMSPAGQLFVYMGGATPDTVPGSIVTNDGGPIGIVNDLNGDGRCDVLAEIVENEVYRIGVRFGQRPLATTVDAELTLPDQRATDFVSAGDANHDGYGDFLVVGAFGMNYVALYLGGVPLPTTPVWVTRGSSIGNRVHTAAGVGDINGDGAADYAVGYQDEAESQMRRGRVRIFGGIPVSVTPQPSVPLPQSLALSAYPNPFNSTTEIRYALPRSSHVSLKVFDVTGREVVMLVDRVMSAGEQRVQWNAEGAASGVYFVHFEAVEKTMTQKLLLVR